MPTDTIILVTGGTGLLGSAIQAIQKDFPYTLRFLGSDDADLRDANATEKLFRESNASGILHLAANVGGLFKNMRDPVALLEDNLLINTNVLRAAHKADIKNVLCVLSTCIFPDKVTSYPITAEMLHDGPPHQSNEGYAFAKRILETHCKAYRRQYSYRYFCVVPTNIYGPHDNFHLDNAHVIPALIHKCWLSKKEETSFVVSGSGNPLRQFIFSEDLARILLWAYEHYTHIEIPLIACPPDSELSIAEVVTEISMASSFKGSIVFDTEKADGQFKKTADSDSLGLLDHGIKFTPFREGITKTILWFQEASSQGKLRL